MFFDSRDATTATQQMLSKQSLIGDNATRDPVIKREEYFHTILLPDRLVENLIRKASPFCAIVTRTI